MPANKVYRIFCNTNFVTENFSFFHISLAKFRKFIVGGMVFAEFFLTNFFFAIFRIIFTFFAFFSLIHFREKREIRTKFLHFFAKVFVRWNEGKNKLEKENEKCTKIKI